MLRVDVKVSGSQCRQDCQQNGRSKKPNRIYQPFSLIKFLSLSKKYNYRFKATSDGAIRKGTAQNYKWQNRKEYKGKTNWTYRGKGEGFALHFYHGIVMLAGLRRDFLILKSWVKLSLPLYLHSCPGRGGVNSTQLFRIQKSRLKYCPGAIFRLLRNSSLRQCYCTLRWRRCRIHTFPFCNL